MGCFSMMNTRSFQRGGENNKGIDQKSIIVSWFPIAHPFYIHIVLSSHLHLARGAPTTCSTENELSPLQLVQVPTLSAQ